MTGAAESPGPGAGARPEDWAPLYGGAGARVLLIGTLPPPLGGISVHLSRLSGRLRADGLQVRVYDPGKHRRFRGADSLGLLAALWTGRYRVVHLHGLDSGRTFLAVLQASRRLLRFRLFITVHNLTPLASQPPGNLPFLRRFVGAADLLIAVNGKSLDYLREAGVPPPPRTLIRSAFLPPPVERAVEVMATYPRDTLEFLRSRRPLIVANAFKLVFHSGTDLYGLDMCVELARRLLPEHPGLGLLFALADDSANPGYLREIRGRIESLGLSAHFHFLTGQKELWPVFLRADLMVRPTCIDADGISIREALHCGCPAVASDVCRRAEGTIIFRNRDGDDFHAKAGGRLAAGLRA